MAGLSAAEAEVLFAGEFLGCFFEARDARGCVRLGGNVGRGRGRNLGGAGKGSSGFNWCWGVWIRGGESVTDVTGRIDRGTRQTCKRGQEQD